MLQRTVYHPSFHDLLQPVIISRCLIPKNITSDKHLKLQSHNMKQSMHHCKREKKAKQELKVKLIKKMGNYKDREKIIQIKLDLISEVKLQRSW